MLGARTGSLSYAVALERAWAACPGSHPSTERSGRSSRGAKPIVQDAECAMTLVLPNSPLQRTGCPGR